MAAELQPPEGPTTTAAVAAVAATNATNISTIAATPTTTTTTTTTTVPVPPENAGPPPPSQKRQRRPSVRLGEIGDQSGSLSYEAHVRRTRIPWRLAKESSKSVKARSLTNLVNGEENMDLEEAEAKNQNGDVNRSYGLRRKGKRGTEKRVRMAWTRRTEEGEREGDGDSREDREEGLRDLDLDLDLEHSSMGRVVMPQAEHKCSRSEGVRTWLIELGLSRYAPVFEVHEVDDEVLPLLTLEDLKDMGVNAVGSRRKLYSAIQKLRRGFS